MLRSQIRVLELPPAFGQPEDQIDPVLRTSVLEQEQQSAGGKQGLDMVQGLTQVCRGMQDVGRYDHLEGVGGKSLLDRVTFDVQELVVEIGIVLELLACPEEEKLGDIAEGVLAVGGQTGEQ